MELHNPPNVNLPPLKIQKSQIRQKMENDPKILNFLKTNLLLDAEFQKLYLDLCRKSQLIDDFIESIQTIDHPIKPGIPVRWLKRTRSKVNKSLNTFSRLEAVEHFRNLSQDEKKQKNEASMVVLKEHFKEHISSIKRHSSGIENKLSQFESSRKLVLDILTQRTLFVCRACNRLLSKDRFRQTKCLCGNKVQSIRDTTKVPIAYFGEALRQFITKNCWFEYGIDYILRRKNFQTLCGYYVLGHSGVWHEIDNIAENKKDNFRFFCECKTGSINPSDIFILAGKMTDIGCSRGYIFCLEKTVPKETVYLTRSRNVAIITDVIHKTDDQLLQNIME
jgi:hypothetical protein